MTRKASYRRINALAAALFLIGLALVIYLKAWWPGIMLAVGVPLALRQYLLGRHSDMWVSVFVFGGVFVTAQFSISWQILVPALFAIGGVYIFIREYFATKDELIEEQEEEKK